MKEHSFPSRINLFVTRVLDVLDLQDKPSPKLPSGKVMPTVRRTRPDRKDFLYYQPVIDNETQQIAGHLTDISAGGFKLDVRTPTPINKDFQFIIKLPGEVFGKTFIAFNARSKWCNVDPIDPYVYNVGYQLIHISAGDLEIFTRMMEKYGKDQGKRRGDLRRSNKW